MPRVIDLTEYDTGWRVTLNRPDKANSLTGTMLARLAEVFEEAEAAQVPALILTGTGRVFSAGADLDEARAGLAVDPVWERVSGALAAYRGLSVAALNGTLAGGAFGMALACDLRLAVPEAKFFYPVMKLGFLPQPSDPRRLVALVGPARAKLILMGGVKISAQEALGFGLIDRLAAPEDLLAEADTLCADAANATTQHRTAIKAMCGAPT